MSWADLLGEDQPALRASASETARFGLAVDRLLVADGASLDDAGVVALAATSQADLVVLRYPARRVGLFAGLLAGGRDVLLADQLVYWRLRTGTGRAPAADPRLTVGPPPAGATADLVGEIFTGYGNHYLADPVLDPGAALAGYQEWAVASAGGDGALALLLDSEPVGLATTSSEPGTVEIELAGVLGAHQGQGLYAHLLAGIEAGAAAAGAEQVVISTQAHNTGVQRAWARYGFEPVVTFCTVHLLRAGLLGGSA
ncbi:MAG: GNAT family N-acetyltransferase [Marmoricola sp.]